MDYRHAADAHLRPTGGLHSRRNGLLQILASPSSVTTRKSPNKFGFSLAAPSGDFMAFARELFMSDYDMGDGGHVFLTC